MSWEHLQKPVVGKAIQRRRQALGLSPEELAAKAKISRTTIYRAFRGEILSVEHLQRLSVALGWPQDALARMFGGEDVEAWVLARPDGATTSEIGLQARVRELEDRLERLEALEGLLQASGVTIR